MATPMKYCARNSRMHDSDQQPTVSLRSPCLSVDQIQRELEAIAAFDNLFLARSEPCTDEIVGFELRKLRRQELLRLAESLRRLGS